MQIVENEEENIEDCRNIRHVAKNIWVGKILSGNNDLDTIVENGGKNVEDKKVCWEWRRKYQRY